MRAVEKRIALHVSLRRSIQHALSISLFTAFFAVTFAAPFLIHYEIPGGDGDPRFNLYILEHVYQWLTGQATLVSPPIFYPYPFTLFFSDTHIGTAWIYALFRQVGFSDLRSYTLWLFMGYFSTLWAAYYVLVLTDFKPFVAGVGATIFAFSLPALQQVGHPQLAYRCGVPLAIYYTWRMLRIGSVTNGVTAICWLFIQILMGIYVGVFLAILMLSFLIVYSILNYRNIEWGRVSISALNINGWRSWLSLRSGAQVTVSVVFGLTTIVLLSGYVSTARLYDLHRPWSEIITMLPRPESYLIMDALPYWKLFSLSLQDVPMRHEHNLFMGLGVLYQFLAGIIYLSVTGTNSCRRSFAKALMLSLIPIVCVVTVFWGSTLYQFLAFYPGVAAIRAVTRIIVVLMFPIAVVSAIGLTWLLGNTRLSPITWTVGVFIVSLTLYDTVSLEKSASPAEPVEQRVEKIIEQAKAASSGVDMPILSLAGFDDRPPLYLHLDAMRASQRLGWPTAEGYSGFGVRPGLELNCGSAFEQYYSFIDWSVARGEKVQVDPANLIKRTVVIGNLECPKTLFTRGPPPSADAASKVTLSPVSLMQKDHHLVLKVKVTNRSDEPIAAWSSNPVRFSWAFQRDGDQPAAWLTRQGIGADLPARGEIVVPIVAAVPSERGSYHIMVSLVSEDRFWFHDHGMKVLVFDDRIQISN